MIDEPEMVRDAYLDLSQLAKRVVQLEEGRRMKLNDILSGRGKSWRSASPYLLDWEAVSVAA